MDGMTGEKAGGGNVRPAMKAQLHQDMGMFGGNIADRVEPSLDHQNPPLAALFKRPAENFFHDLETTSLHLYSLT